MKVEPTNFKTPDDEMSFGDFVIRYEHKLLRNFYTNRQIKSYYTIFEEYIAICIGLLAFLNNFNRNDFINEGVENFVQDKFYGDKIIEIKNTIAKTEIKKILYHQHTVRFQNLI